MLVISGSAIDQSRSNQEAQGKKPAANLYGIGYRQQLQRQDFLSILHDGCDQLALRIVFVDRVRLAKFQSETLLQFPVRFLN